MDEDKLKEALKEGVSGKEYLTDDDALKMYEIFSAAQAYLALTEKNTPALEALEDIYENEKSNIQNTYSGVLDYPSMKRKYDRDMEWIEEQYKTIREALEENEQLKEKIKHLKAEVDLLHEGARRIALMNLPEKG